MCTRDSFPRDFGLRDPFGEKEFEISCDLTQSDAPNPLIQLNRFGLFVTFAVNEIARSAVSQLKFDLPGTQARVDQLQNEVSVNPA